MRSVAPSRWAGATPRAGKGMQAKSGPLARTPGPQVPSIMSRRSSTLNSGVLPGWVPIASTSRSASRAAWRTRSRWPLVTGSNDPGKSAVRGMVRGSSARPEPPQGPDHGLARGSPTAWDPCPGVWAGFLGISIHFVFSILPGTAALDYQFWPSGPEELGARFVPPGAMLTWRDSGQRVPGDADAHSVDGHPGARPRRLRAG